MAKPNLLLWTSICSHLIPLWTLVCFGILVDILIRFIPFDAHLDHLQKKTVRLLKEVLGRARRCVPGLTQSVVVVEIWTHKRNLTAAFCEFTWNHFRRNHQKSLFHAGLTYDLWLSRSTFKVIQSLFSGIQPVFIASRQYLLLNLWTDWNAFEERSLHSPTELIQKISFRLRLI